MIFLNQNILFGLSLIVLPVLIHLFNLKKIKKLEFSTLMFLKEIQKSKLKRIKIKQLILLLLRVLAIIIIVLAFANPVIEGYYGINAGNLGKTGIFILDDSYSMDIKDETGSHFDVSKKYLTEIIATYNPNDKIIFLTSSKLSLRGYAPNQTGASDLQDSIKNSQTKYKVFYLDEIDDLTNSSDFGNENLIKEIFIFSDFQKSNFREINVSNQPSRNSYLYAVNTSVRTGNNISIYGLELKTKILELGRQVKISIKVKNSSGNAVLNKIVKLFNENEFISEHAVDLNPGENRSIDFFIKPQKTGLNKFHFELVRDEFPDDELAQDNKSYFVLNIPEKVNIAVLSDGGLENIKYLKLALETANKFIIDSLNRGTELFSLNTNLTDNKNNVLLICNKGKFNEYERNIIKEYLGKGKGVFCFAGRELNISDYDSLFASLGFFTISKMNRVNKDNTENTGILSFKEIDLTHPVFNGVFKKEDIDYLDNARKIESPSIKEYFQVKLNNNSASIITLSDDNPFLVESKYLQGKFIFCTVSPDNDMSDFPMTSIFPTIVIRTIQYLNADDNEITDYKIGKQNVMAINSKNKIKFISTPENIEYGFSLNSSGNSLTGKEYFVFPYGEYSQVPGFYNYFDSSKALVGTAAVNYEETESDLEKYDVKKIENYFKHAGYNNFKYVNNPEILKSELINARKGTDLTKYFLILALIFVAAEILYGRKLEKG